MGVRIRDRKALARDGAGLERHMESASRVAREVLASPVGPYCERIILYGSCARHEQGPSSDVDLLVVLDEEARELGSAPLLGLYPRLSDVGRELPEPDVRFQYGDSWERDPLTYFQFIRKEGKDVWTRQAT